MSLRKRSIGILLLAAVIVAFVGMSSPIVLRAHRDPLLNERAKLSRLGDQLLDHGSANDGSFPSGFSALDGDRSVSMFRSPRTKRLKEWLYFPGFQWGDPGSTILAASPSSFSKSDGVSLKVGGEVRLVLSLDGRVVTLRESDYQACVAEQQAPSWRATEGERSQPTNETWGFLKSPVWDAWKESVFTPEKGEADLGMLLDELETGGKTERWHAADQLTQIRPLVLDVVPELFRALSDSEAAYNAAHGLAVMSLQEEAIVPGLAEIVASGEGKARYWATVALTQIGLERAGEAVPAVTEALDADGDLPGSAAKAIAGAGPDGVEAVPRLIKMAGDGASWDRKCAMIALGRIGPAAKDALPTLSAIFDRGGDYRFDAARALWKIDPSQAERLVPQLIRVIEAQRNADGPNHPFTSSFASAMELLGEMGPAAGAAIPCLQANLMGGARSDAAWALWRIDKSFIELATPIFTASLQTSIPPVDRLDRMAVNRRVPSGVEGFECGFTTRMVAFGRLWRMHPERRAEMGPILVALLHEWEAQKVLNKLPWETRPAIQALEELVRSSPDPNLKLLAGEALQEIKTTDPGCW